MIKLKFTKRKRIDEFPMDILDRECIIDHLTILSKKNPEQYVAIDKDENFLGYITVNYGKITVKPSQFILTRSIYEKGVVGYNNFISKEERKFHMEKAFESIIEYYR